MSRATAHIDRRALIRAGATATLAAGATVNLGAVALTRAAAADPIFALIEAHRRADKDFGAVLTRISREQEADACTFDHDKAEADASHLEVEAMDAVLDLPATTAAGLVAALRYVESLSEENSSAFPLDREGAVGLFMQALVDAIERVAS
jgi:hypothetical protein